MRCGRGRRHLASQCRASTADIFPVEPGRVDGRHLVVPGAAGIGLLRLHTLWHYIRKIVCKAALSVSRGAPGT